MIGISCLDIGVNSTKTIARMVKDIDREIYVVVGGITPTVYPEVFSDCRDIDILIQGEGEITLLNVVNAVFESTDPSKLEGTAYFENGRLIKNKPQKFIGDTCGLDCLPHTEREFLYFDPITWKVCETVFLGGICTSRGCAFACKFCASSHMWSCRLFFRNIDSVIDELLELRGKYGKKFDNFYIFDDNFLSSKKRVMYFCEKLASINEKFTFRCFARADSLLDEEVVYALVKAGCYSMHLGLESGSDAVLKSMNKHLTVEKSLRAAENLNAYELEWRAFIILGTPDETLDDLKSTIDFIDNIDAPVTRCFIFHPYLGTDYYNYLGELGIPLDLNYILRGNQDITTYCGNRISIEDFDKLSDGVMKMADVKNKQWAESHVLSGLELTEALEIECVAIEYFSKINTKTLVIGNGRDIRWIAALLYANNIGNEFFFFDMQHPEGYSLKYAKFLSITIVQNLKIPVCAIDDILCKSTNFPKRLIYNIIQESSHLQQ
jgi:tRNA A37 methylthiotransferase MiaB